MNDPDPAIKIKAGSDNMLLQPSSADTSKNNSDSGNGRNLNGTRRPTILGRVQRLFRSGKVDATQVREDLADVLAESEVQADGFTSEEKTMLNNVLRLQHIRVEDVMTPRAELEAIEINTKLGELLRAFEETGHSRLPVYAETLDDPRGMVHIRDVVTYITQTASQSKSQSASRKRPLPADLDLKNVSLSKPLRSLNLLREILFVPPSMAASDLMRKMQATRIQIALVIDEYGGTDGLVSLEDLVEVVVGDIEDEHDDDDGDLIVETADGIFVCDARAELDDIALRVGDDFQIGETGEDVETIGGLIFAIIGRVPVRGEVIEALGFEFRVIDADPRRIKKIELERSGKRKRVS
ncbi:MAG: hemolysin family protein [Rhizobiaceae bacterium]|nr:hemolysin family protein [Rhizobiaceae bacterium]